VYIERELEGQAYRFDDILPHVGLECGEDDVHDCHFGLIWTLEPLFDVIRTASVTAVSVGLSLYVVWRWVYAAFI